MGKNNWSTINLKNELQWEEKFEEILVTFKKLTLEGQLKVLVFTKALLTSQEKPFLSA